MAGRSTALLVASVGVVGTVAGVAISLFVEHYFTKETQHKQAWFDYLTASHVPEVSKRHALLLQADSEALELLVAGFRAEAKNQKEQPDECNCATKETKASREPVETRARMYELLRARFRPDDPLNRESILTLLCPNIGSCYGGCYISHLRACAATR